MFSVEGSGGKARSSLRSTRRRPRNSDGLQQGRRKRSKLGDDTFVAVDAQPNGNGSLVMNGHATSIEDSSSLMRMDMPVREKKKTLPKRALNEDAATLLTKGSNYEVLKFPSFPAQLSNGPTPFRASALPSAGLALALTADNALVWEYSSPSGSNKAHAIPLPPSLAGADPLPLGAIVRNGPANDFGVVAVAPATGRIVFWENVDSAEARGHFVQRHQGVEGSIKLYSGEQITDLVDIEHAGYILVLSSGRLAQLTLRDTQGRPSIVANVMNAPNGAGGGFFSFRGLLGGAIRKTIASVKARPSESKGQMEIITATKNGTFQVWDLSWSGQQMFKREFDANGVALAAMQQGSAPEIRGQQEAHILDFAIMRQQSEGRELSLMTLAALTGRETLDYFLLELRLSGTGPTISRAILLRNFQQPELLPQELTGTLFLPRNGDLALVQFPTAVVVAALDEVEESPETQLITDSGSPLLPFQDSIYFREDADVRVVGHALEDHVKNRRNIVLFIQDYGTLQISARPRPTGSTPDENRQRVTARDKLKQASLFSTVPGTILDFRIKYKFAPEEIENAAISLSHGFLKSTFDNLGRPTTTMEELINQRALVLYTLIEYLRYDFEPFSFILRWDLLAHAEKLHAATHLWRWYQKKLRDKEANPDAYPQQLLLKNLVISLGEKHRSPMGENDTDPVRHFFLHDINNIGVLIPWGWTNLRVLYIDRGAKDGPSVEQVLSEANDIMLVVLENGLSYRQLNAGRYGIDPAYLEDGVMHEGTGLYEEMRNIWSSSHNMINSLRSLVDCSRTVAEESYESGRQDEQVTKIAKDTPRLVRMCCQTHIERFRWASASIDDKEREMGRKLREEWDNKVRPPQIYGLMEIGLASDGMNLAEKYHDMSTLAKLIWDETEYLEQSKSSTSSKIELAEIGVKLNRLKDRTSRYFKEHGKDFAEAYFRKVIAENRAGLLFESKGCWEPEMLSSFLMAESSRSKLVWIERVKYKDFASVGIALAKSALMHETNSWCHRVELSISKLAMMCQDETKPETAAKEGLDDYMKEEEVKQVHNIIKKVDDTLELSKIRDLVYDRLLPIVNGALDDNAAISLLMTEFGQGRLETRPALQGLLRQGFDEMIHHRVMDPALMIDLLTLMDHYMVVDINNPIRTNEFVFALQWLTLSWKELHRTTRLALRGLIWKRLMIKDNWAYFNESNDVPSERELHEVMLGTNLGWTMKQLYEKTSADKRYEMAWFESFEELYGKGCTDGEFCIRFSNEEIRKPIVDENKLDEEDFDAIVKDYELERWFGTCLRAVKWAVDEGGDQLMAADAEAETESDESDVNGVAMDGDEVQESVEMGYPHGGDEEGADGDVEMTDS